MPHGYEPSRISDLSRHCRWSIAALDAIRSTDPAAAEALAAVSRIRSVLADDLMPAVDAIALRNPLGGSSGLFRARLRAARRPSALDQWMDQQFPSTPESTMSDEELLSELQAFGDGAPNEALLGPEHPHWDGLAALTADIARRSIDPRSGELTDFGHLLVDNVWQLPALPIAALHIDVHPSFGAAVIAAIFDPDTANSTTMHRLEAFTVEPLLTRLLDHPRVLADLLLTDQQRLLDGSVDIEHSVIFGLMDSDVVDPQVVADAMSNVLDADGPVDLADIQITLALLVQTANTTAFERGFPSPIAVALATSFVERLPNLESQLRLDQTVYFDEIGDADDAILLGEYADVRDFIGAILVDPAGLVLLYALGAQAEAMGRGQVAEKDVNAYGELLRESFKENLAEIEIAAARDRAEWAAAMTVLSVAVGVGPVGRALGPVGVKFAQAAIKRLGSAAPGAARREQNDDVGLVANLMIRFGGYEGFLDHHDTRNGVAVGGGDASRTREARAALAAAWEEFEAGEPLGKVGETLDDVGGLIEELDTDGFTGDMENAVDGIDPIGDAADLD